MIIGINASSALKENPTGVEEYTYQLIKHLAMIPESRAHRFVLYLNPRLKSSRLNEFEKLPDNFEIKFLCYPSLFIGVKFLWTQVRLAWEMINSKIDILFIPVHVLPFIHPTRSVVAVHGLEYELLPDLYSLFSRAYTRVVTRYALNNATNIISVSENTKKDLVKIYGGDPGKISVVHHGINSERSASRESCDRSGFILYIGRIELKKNILGIIEAYNELRKKNKDTLNKLVMVGGKGFGFEKIEKAISGSAYKKDIITKGYISADEKKDLWKRSAVFIFPSFYEGFGLPILEAQQAEVPVITSNSSCLPEIAGQGAIFVDPKNSSGIAEALKKALTDKALRQNLIQAGRENIKRFSWEKCARETLKVLVK